MNKIFLNGTYSREDFETTNGMTLDLHFITTDLCDKLSLVGSTDAFKDLETGDKIIVAGVLHFSRQEVDLQNGLVIEKDAFVAVDEVEKIKE